MRPYTICLLLKQRHGDDTLYLHFKTLQTTGVFIETKAFSKWYNVTSASIWGRYNTRNGPGWLHCAANYGRLNRDEKFAKKCNATVTGSVKMLHFKLEYLQASRKTTFNTSFVGFFYYYFECYCLSNLTLHQKECLIK